MVKSLISVGNPKFVSSAEPGNDPLSSIRTNVGISLVLILILFIVGASVYHSVEGWTWLESIYFMTVTFTTVGYGDLVPKTDYGRLFTIVIIWAGISTAFFLLYNIAAYREAVVDKQIDENLTKFRNFFMSKFRSRSAKSHSSESASLSEKEKTKK